MKTSRGFTLIELMVSVTLFSVVMILIAGTYIKLISLNEQVRSTNELVNNLSFAVDTMERTIRTGTNYSGGGTSFSFTDDQNRSVTFSLQNNGITECISSNCGPLTNPSINVSTLNFLYNNAVRGSGKQPQVNFVVKGSILSGPHVPPINFSLEGGATQRTLNF